MSNFLAVATVTATLERTLQAAVGADVPGASVTTVRPNGPNSGVPDTGVNLFLYQVTPNVALRNRDLPSRRPDGQLTQQPIAALDLHYLLSFYGAEADLEPQRLLGSAVRTLHAQPLLVRETIRNTVDAVGFLNGSNLADQAETVRFTPLPLNLEELSKLWSVFFQTTYVLSVAYQASVVLISADEAPVLAQPVQERVVFAVPSVDLTVQALQPDLLDDLQLWLRADAAVAYDSQGRVTRWTDQSGRGSNSFQNDDARKPRFIREGLNGKPVLRFDGVDDYLALEAPSYVAPGQIEGLTLFVLVRSSAAAAQILVGFDGNEYWRAALRGAAGGPSWQTREEAGGGDDSDECRRNHRRTLAIAELALCRRRDARQADLCGRWRSGVHRLRTAARSSVRALPALASSAWVRRPIRSTAHWAPRTFSPATWPKSCYTAAASLTWSADRSSAIWSKSTLRRDVRLEFPEGITGRLVIRPMPAPSGRQATRLPNDQANYDKDRCRQSELARTQSSVPVGCTGARKASVGALCGSGR